jgi:hypothetical protein
MRQAGNECRTNAADADAAILLTISPLFFVSPSRIEELLDAKFDKIYMHLPFLPSLIEKQNT